VPTLKDDSIRLPATAGVIITPSARKPTKAALRLRRKV